MYPRPNPGVSSTKSQREITLLRDAIRYLGSAFSAPMASWLDDLGLNELEHIKDGASAFAQELHPINSAEDFISFVVALNLYPPGTPLRAERIAGEMPAGLSAPAVRYLLSKLPIVDRLASQLRDDPSRKTVRLVPDVEHCVACGLAGEAVPLVVKRADKCSSPTVYAEHGRLKGELNGLSCPRCSAWHSMSYAEGGTRIPAGKQVPYPGATASSRRWIQLSQSTVFENSLLDRLSAQMVHSHTGFETFCHEWAMRCGESKDLAHTMRRRLGHTWLAWSLLRWRDENASRAGEPLPFEPLGFTSDEQLDATLLEQCQGRDAGVAASSPSACCPASPHFGRESTRRAASSRCLAAVRATATSSMDTINIGASAVPTGTRALSIWASTERRLWAVLACPSLDRASVYVAVPLRRVAPTKPRSWSRAINRRSLSTCPRAKGSQPRSISA